MRLLPCLYIGSGLTPPLCICSYRTISLDALKNNLGFETLDDTRIFLSEHQITTFTNPNSPDADKVLDCRPAIPEINRSFEEKYRKVTIKGAI